MERVSTAERRDPKKTVLATETVCEDWIRRRNYLAVDLFGYIRLVTEEKPITKCEDFEQITRTDYPQALFVTNRGPERFWYNHIPLMDSVANACGTSQEMIKKWSYQGIDLINGKPAETAWNQLSAADRYGNRYTGERIKGILKVSSMGTYGLPTGEQARTDEYSFDMYQWITMKPKGGGGWGQTPLFRLFSGKGAQTATSAPPMNPHDPEYAAWFAKNKPTRTECKFLIVDLSNAPRYQEQQSVTSSPSWLRVSAGFNDRLQNPLK